MPRKQVEIELAEGEWGYVCNGKLSLSPTEIGEDMVFLRIGETEDSEKEARVKLGESVKVKAGRQFEVSLLGIGEGSRPSAGLEAWGERRLRSAAVLAIAYALVIYAHAITAILLSIVVVPLVVASPFTGLRVGKIDFTSLRQSVRPHIEVVFVLAGALGVGLLLSSPYWLPLERMAEHVALARAAEGYFQTTGHVVHWHQLFSRAWGFGSPTVDDAQDKMPLQLGAVHFALACVGMLRGWRKPLLLAAALSYLASIVCMTPWCEAFWRLPVLERMQFPWRSLTVVTGLQCVLLASLGGDVSQLKPPWRRVALLGAALVVTVAWQWPQFQTNLRVLNVDARIAEEIATSRQQFRRYALKDEFLPRTVEVTPRHPRAGAPIVQAFGANFAFPTFGGAKT